MHDFNDHPNDRDCHESTAAVLRRARARQSEVVFGLIRGAFSAMTTRRGSGTHPKG